MRFEVVTGTPEEYESAIPAPDCGRSKEEYTEYVTEKLSGAEVSGNRIVCMQSIEMAGKGSDNFAAIGWVEEAVRDFQAKHELPEIVRIVCDSDETARQYKFVYNMFYAETKAARLMDDKWD